MSYPCLVGYLHLKLAPYAQLQLQFFRRPHRSTKILWSSASGENSYFPIVQMDATFCSYFPTLGCWLAAAFWWVELFFGEDDVVHICRYCTCFYFGAMWCICGVQPSLNFKDLRTTSSEIDGTRNHPKVGNTSGWEFSDTCLRQKAICYIYIYHNLYIYIII